MSWWDIGEGAGQQTLATNQLRKDTITCAFCNEKGKFRISDRKEKVNASGKSLHYDLITCEQCGNITSVFWGIGSSGLQGIEQMPWPKTVNKYPSHWPDDVGRYWLQARRAINASDWDAAALMARSALQLAIRHQGITDKSLYAEIDSLKERGTLPPIMVEWAHEVRELGNDNAHPKPGALGTSAADAKAIIEYLSLFLQFTFDLPHKIAIFRKSRTEKT